jgi:hypothetical protein
MSTHDHLTPEELAAQEADLLPDREAMSLIDPSSALAYGSTGLPGADTAPTTTTGGDAAHGATGTAGGTADLSSHLTDGTTNPATGYSPTTSSSATS